MSKLGTRQARERARTIPARVNVRSRKIVRTFPRNVKQEARSLFVEQARMAIERYLALVPQGKPKRRGLLPHRPDDTHRHGLMSDLFDAYMTARDDDIQARGFKPTADAVLAVAGLSLEVTDHDLANLRAQRKPFADWVKKVTAEVSKAADQLSKDHGSHASDYAARLAHEARAEEKSDEAEFWGAVAAALTQRAGQT
jgi:hypothetical protein